MRRSLVPTTLGAMLRASPLWTRRTLARAAHVACVGILHLAGILATACATEHSRTIATEPVRAAGTPYTGPRCAATVGAFPNHSPYLRGVFFDGEDKLGGQARVILTTHLTESGRFALMDRDQGDEAAREAAMLGGGQRLRGAEVIVSGEVTEFGRKEVGDHELYGILGRGKNQSAYAKVSVLITDVRTSQIIYSVQGAAEYSLSDREVLGFGSTAAYDSTLNGKVLDLAITDAVNKLIDAFQRGDWRPSGAAVASSIERP